MGMMLTRGNSEFEDEFVLGVLILSGLWVIHVKMSHVGPDARERKLGWNRVFEMLTSRRWRKSWDG